MLLFVLAVANLIFIAVLLHFKKQDLALALAILEIVIVYFAQTLINT